MAITLQDFTSGDTGYIAKHNSNNTTIENAVLALETALSGAAATNSSTGPIIHRLFGTVTARIGPGSCSASISGQTVIFTTGWVNRGGSAIVEKGASQTVDLTGLANDTYYFSIDSVGTVSVDGATSSYDLFSVDKSGTTLSNLTAIAPIVYASPQSYEVHGFKNGAPTSSEVVVRQITTVPVTFPAGLSGSACKAGTAATGSTVFNIAQNGSNIGSLTFAAAGTTATFSFTTTTTTSAGDIITIVAPVAADATLANIVFALLGYTSP